MLKMKEWIFAAGLILGGGMWVRGQANFSGGPAGQVPPEIAEMQKARERLMKEAAPELYAFQEKQRGIEAEIRDIVASLSRKEIGKEAARERILPLIKEEQEMKSDPEFLVQQRLAQAYFSMPEYQAKMKNLMDKFAAKQKARR
jgi:hypothetical protein